MSRLILEIFREDAALSGRYVGASQSSRYLLEKTGIPARDKNARLNPVKFFKYSRFRVFLAPL